MRRAAVTSDAPIVQTTLAFDLADLNTSSDAAPGRQSARASRARAARSTRPADASLPSHTTPGESSATSLRAPLIVADDDASGGDGQQPAASNRRGKSRTNRSAALSRSTTPGAIDVAAGSEPGTRARKRATRAATQDPAGQRDTFVRDSVTAGMRPEPQQHDTSELEVVRVHVEQPIVPSSIPAARRSAAGHRAPRSALRPAADHRAATGRDQVVAPQVDTEIRETPRARPHHAKQRVADPEPQGQDEQARAATTAEAETSTGQRDLAGTSRRELTLGPIFLMCYDDSRKRTIEEKIAWALAAYAARFSSTGNLVWVNMGVADGVKIAHVVIERRTTVPPDNIWVGKQTGAVAPSDS